MNKRKIYVASSWRNNQQQSVVNYLRYHGHAVYDFKNPKEGNNGFHWSNIDELWQCWSDSDFRSGLDHPIAESGFKLDFDAMKWADTFVLVMPCGRSAHLELGWACGAGKDTCILLSSGEPELMYKMVNKLAVNMSEIMDWLSK